jgi:thiol:disulfide interchange protein DsbA
LTRKAPTPARILRLRRAIAAGVVVLVLAVVGLGIWYTTDSAPPGAYVEGIHYEIIDDTSAPDPRKPIVVREYFSYYCVHCRNFDPQVEEWRRELPEGVVFERSPVVFSPVWRIMGQSYYALAAANALSENHPRLFRVIHDGGRQFTTAESVADFVDGHGITRDAFLGAYNAPDVHRAINEADLRARMHGINSVPSLVVGDHYRINLGAVPRAQAFEVVEHIVALIRAGA